MQEGKKGRQEQGNRKIKERWRPQMKIACVFFMARPGRRLRVEGVTLPHLLALLEFPPGSSLDTAEPLPVIHAGRGLGGLSPVTGQNGLLGHFFHSAPIYSQRSQTC